MTTKQEYLKEMHRLGRWITIGAILIFVGIPAVVCTYYDIMPSLQDIFVASMGLLVIFIPVGMSETLTYTPVMGSSYYLAGITGNIMNLKLPAVINALKISDVEQGTQEGDVIAGIAVAVSSIVTVITIIISVVLLAPLKPIMELEVVKTASAYILPALFGCLILSALSGNMGGGIVIRGRMKAAVIPLILAVALYLALPELYGILQGFVIILCIPILYIATKRLYKKGKIQVTISEEG